MLRSRHLPWLLILPVLAMSACGGDNSKDIDTASYTCADFNKSLRTKNDNTAGEFINKLREQAKLGQSKQVERRELTLGIYFACRGTAGSTKPATKAIVAAKQMKAGKFHLPSKPGKTKTSDE